MDSLTSVIKEVIKADVTEDILCKLRGFFTFFHIVSSDVNFVIFKNSTFHNCVIIVKTGAVTLVCLNSNNM